MKRLLPAFLALFISLALSTPFEAEAKRLGGGGSFGYQRSVPQRQATPTPTKQATPAPAPTTPATVPQKRSWMGPLAGLAAGIGLAALLSHFGLGEEAASFLMIALLALAAVMLVRWLLNRSRMPAQAQRPLQYAGAAPAGSVLPLADTPAGATASATAEPALPADFDVEAFVRQAKLNFIRLQAANDAANLADIREFTSPEVYAEIKLQIEERGSTPSLTEVARLDAEVLEATEEDGRQIVSVRYHGLIREDSADAAAFDEVWFLTRPADGSRGWVVAGIQQIS
jgi:predicted lipid-binding transport protein (Tim44 family)